MSNNEKKIEYQGIVTGRMTGNDLPVSIPKQLSPNAPSVPGSCCKVTNHGTTIVTEERLPFEPDLLDRKLDIAWVQLSDLLNYVHTPEIIKSRLKMIRQHVGDALELYRSHNADRV